MNIFLAPRSNERSHENFKSTIEDGRTYEFFEPFLTAQEKEILKGRTKIQVWGNKESLKSRWNKMKRGDFVLFYASGAFYYSARVILTKHDKALGAKLWPVDEDGEPWTCLFFVENVTKIDLPIKVLQELAGYEPTWDRVQGFMMLRESGLKTIESKFSSVEKFLNQKPETFEALDEVIEEFTGEMVEDEVERSYKIEELSKVFNDAAQFAYQRESHRLDSSPHKVRIESRAQKKRIAKLEGYACQVCDWQLTWTDKNGKKKTRIDVDHIVDKANGGGEEMINLWVLCPNCHVKKTLGVIKIDIDARKVYENGIEIQLKHDNHLWKTPKV